jgi:acetolactate synthase-1/2/3 large subunit
MATTYGRLTEKPGVYFSTLGPGAINLVIGVVQILLIGAPFISISGQKTLNNNWQGSFSGCRHYPDDVATLQKGTDQE